MSLAEFKPVPVPKIGGLMTFLKPVDIPAGYSPNLQNVRFLPRAVFTRAGLTTRMTKPGHSFLGATQITGNTTNGDVRNSNKTLITVDESGSVDFQDPVSGNPDSVMLNAANAGARMQSQTAFGRQMMAFYDPDLSPGSPIRQWDGVRSTVLPALPLPTIAVSDSATTGNFAAATYQVVILFETIDHCFIFASQQAAWTTAGGKQLHVTGIPLGTAGMNVIARWVCISDAAGAVLYRFPAYRIADNVTTTFTSDQPQPPPFAPIGGAIDKLIPNAINPPPLSHLAPDGPGAPPVVVDEVATINVAGATQEAPVTLQEAYEASPNVDLAFTLSAPIHYNGDASIIIAGAANAGYDGTFQVIASPTRPPYVTPASGLGVIEFSNPTTPLPPIASGGTLTTAYVTMQTATPHGLSIGQGVIVAGVGAGYNGSFVVENVIDATHFTYFATTGSLGPVGAGGTIAKGGHITAGTRQVWVAFETLFGYITQPCQVSFQWTAAGGKRATVSNLPIGPWYTVARRIFVSLAGLAHLMYITGGGPNNYPSFRVPDNTSTSYTIDFDDTFLAQGSQFDYLTRNFALPPSMGFAVYGGRLATWGAYNTAKFNNANFDGGWGTSGAPLGWSLDATNGAGGQKEVFNAFAGDAWRIIGGGPATSTGQINNPSIAGYSVSIAGATPITQTFSSPLNTNIPYSISLRIRKDAGATGLVNIGLFSPSLGGMIAEGSVNLTGVTTTWAEYVTALTSGLAVIPNDMYIAIWGANVTLNASVWVDHLQVFPTFNPYENSLLRVSNPFDPETFDGVSGFTYAQKDNGQAITACGQIRSFLYILKERSMHVTYDDGVNPPSLWLTRQLDSTVGCGSPNSMVNAVTFLAWSGRAGAYMFTGVRPQKCSQEIQTDWNALNWSQCGTNHTILDIQAKTINFYVCKGADTSPKNAYIYDYSEGMGQEDDPGPRKWGRDQYSQAINASLIFETTSNTQTIYLFGNKSYENVGTDDDGAVIDSFYETAFLKAGESGQDLFGGVMYYIEGNGQFTSSLHGLDDVIIDSLQVETLTASPGKQYELLANMETERAKVHFETAALGTFFTVKGISVAAKPWAEQRRL